MKSVVIVLEDDELVLSSIRAAVEQMGHDCIACGTGDSFFKGLNSAIAALDREYDRITCVLDIFVPGFGVTVFEKVSEEFSFVPILFCSGSADITMAVRLVRDGAFDFIQKPFRLTELIEAIENSLDAFADRYRDFRRRESASDTFDLLTDREQEFLSIQSANPVISLNEIAVIMGVSRRTVEAHRTSLISKVIGDFSTLEEFSRVVQECGRL